MQSPKLFFTILSLSILCNACVEIRDNKKAETPPPQIKEEVYDSLTISERMYFFNGKILDEKSYLQEQKELFEAKAQPIKELKLRLQTLTIEKGGVLIVGDNWLHIQTNEFISESGEITTFPAEQTASDQRDGRNGGLIFVETNSAIGTLLVTLRGENGGKGARGANPGPELNGKDNYTQGKPGDSFNGVSGCKSGGPGGAGEPGKQGYQGGTGMKGGNTGAFQIKMNEDKGFFPVINKFAGKGGIGGDGGGGGQGGLNGPKGHDGCANLSMGGPSRASSGEQGNPGNPGQAGEKQEFCQIIGDKRSCN
ncbi:hypothetical protein [Bdellovibrio sp. NC01]|uniref:hypothetical protein n=1 Tax=Bdellovibrio sp. NC01 TaxID=2220073 RepID=UPI00115B3FC4|nr:hypothetical protein [Bdellovibrio sp. NC01]QDK36622.1 hypothetical protein DOE51_02910 [Bdellovibrio sp. NC01]